MGLLTHSTPSTEETILGAKWLVVAKSEENTPSPSTDMCEPL
jgi:hypothetical protein